MDASIVLSGREHENAIELSIIQSIHEIRGMRVILDFDLARRYQVETKNLNLSVSGRRYLPYAFTEQGVAMLSGLLNSDTAIDTNCDKKAKSMIIKYSKYVLLFLWLTMIVSPIHSQVKHTHDIVLGNLQVKDGDNNLGMVFNGFQLEYRYGVQWKINEHEIRYQPKLGIGFTFNRGMFSGHIPVSPINVTWTMPIFEQNGHMIRVGANFMNDYNYILYTELHDGPMFWTAEIGLSPVICYSYQWNNKRIGIGLQNSLLGFTSYRQGYDPYVFLFTWKDFVVSPHKEMKFGSFNNYNHTTVSVEYVPNISKKHSFMYEFDYFGIFYGKKYSRINHNLIWRISLCKNRKK